MKDNPWDRSLPGWNYATLDIRHGSVVCRDETPTSSDSYVQIARRITGIAAPAAANAHRVLGIASGRSGANIKADSGGRIICAGYAEALVKVPGGGAASLAQGTPLCLNGSRSATYDTTTWDVDFSPDDTEGSNPKYGCLTAPTFGDVWTATNTENDPRVIFGTSATEVNMGPLAYNPVAILREDLASSAAAYVTLTKVEVIPWHRPLPWTVSIGMDVDLATGYSHLVRACGGPGIVVGAIISIGAPGVAEVADFDVLIQPHFGETTTSDKSIFSTLPSISATAEDPTIYGYGGSSKLGYLIVDGLAATLAADEHGVLRAAALRQYPTDHAIIKIDILAQTETHLGCVINVHGIDY
jgi:hypothetical protein